MGQYISTPSGSASSFAFCHPCRHRRSRPRIRPASPPMTDPITASSGRDHTLDLPDECVALIFHSLGSGDRKRCSLVCRRWLAVDGQSRHRLSLDARAGLLTVAPSIFTRFDAVSKLALKCDRRSQSIGDEALSVISSLCPNLTRLKLSACRGITDAGMALVGKNCKNLRKLSCGSCTFTARGIDAVLRGCNLLEELSIKRLRELPPDAGGAAAAAAEVVAGPFIASTSLRSVCFKELYNGQCFVPLIAAAANLRTLKLFRCSGDWDPLLEDIAQRVAGIAEIHLEKLQASDRGLFALAACTDLEILHLVKTPECTDAGVVAVAEKCRMLRKIHIDGWKTNRIGDEGLMAIARWCPNLQELVLIGVNPTALSLAPIASNCRNLERLALCSSETFGDAEISCMAAKCVSLKKLCIKGCPVSDKGMEALAEGCPNLVKVKVKKCKGVTPLGADWLRASRGSLAVNSDCIGQIELQEASISESGMLENIDEQLPEIVDQMSTVHLASSSRGQSSQWKTRVGFLSGRNSVMSIIRRWSNGSSSSHQT